MPNIAGVQFSRKQIDALTAYFQLGYDRKFALSTAISAHLAIPGLRGFWPMSGASPTGQALDMAGLGNHLTRSNDVDFGYDNLIPYADLDGTNQLLSITDAASANAFDITGTEGFILGIQQGITIGGLFRFDDDPPAAIEHLIGKYTAGVDRSYQLLRLTNTTIRFRIYDGAAVQFSNSILTTTNGTWYHLVGKFDTISGDLFNYVNGNEVTTPLAVASINAGAADFSIGAQSTPSLFLDGRAAFCFVSAASLSTTWIVTLHALLRALFE